MRTSVMFKLVLFVSTIALVVSCGGGSSTNTAGIGGTGITATGTVTGFGSVYVNGVEFFTTDDTSFDVDDNSNAGERDLRLGMVVTVTGTVSSDGKTGTAATIVYDDDIQGPVVGISSAANASSRTFTVFGTAVSVQKNVTSFENISFDTLAEDDIVEISGYVDSNDVLNATHVNMVAAVNGGNEVEVKGTILSASAYSFVMQVSGTQLTVNYTGSTDLRKVPGGMLSIGMFVEVKGNWQSSSSSTIAATRVDVESKGLSDNLENASVEGIVTQYQSDSDFKVRGKTIDAAGAIRNPANLVIENGVKVEVQGPVINGVLTATRIEARGGRIQIAATVASVNVTDSVITMNVVSGQAGIPVHLNIKTRLEDEKTHSASFGLASIVDGDYLEIEGYLNDQGEVVANTIQRESAGGVEIRAPVTSVDSIAGTVELLGVVFATNQATRYKINGNGSSDRSSFFAELVTRSALATDVYIAIEDGDNSAPDGFADELKF
ncbi:MAG: DUF5666 domain-containing protein [Gammaproteobacteria bacterium]